MIGLRGTGPHESPSPRRGEGWGGGSSDKARAFGATSSSAPPLDPLPLGEGRRQTEDTA